VVSPIAKRDDGKGEGAGEIRLETICKLDRVAGVGEGPVNVAKACGRQRHQTEELAALSSWKELRSTGLALCDCRREVVQRHEESRL
jgi:hypothetical protein